MALYTYALLLILGFAILARVRAERAGGSRAAAAVEGRIDEPAEMA
jgi:hypothetical protein